MPASAPIGRVAPWVYDEQAAQADLDALESLLTTRDELSEREDILPFLRSHPHLCALIGSYNRRANTQDRPGLEVPLFGQFTADLVSGDSATRGYTLVEFEDGRPNSIFVRRAWQRTEWSPRCEHGLSQLTDWLWLLDDQAHTHLFEEIFGARPVTARVVLVIGRDRSLTAADRRRLEWRRDHVIINSQHLYCCTFEELLRDLRWRALASLGTGEYATVTVCLYLGKSVH
ncbi:MAG TPA: Shedu immune nuclease family protein [Chloroflexota bacterium]|nr:Shedu immune nuclease family protein [Chloroflexota bacterium]